MISNLVVFAFRNVSNMLFYRRVIGQKHQRTETNHRNPKQTSQGKPNLHHQSAKVSNIHHEHGHDNPPNAQQQNLRLHHRLLHIPQNRSRLRRRRFTRRVSRPQTVFWIHNRPPSMSRWKTLHFSLVRIQLGQRWGRNVRVTRRSHRPATRTCNTVFFYKKVKYSADSS